MNIASLLSSWIPVGVWAGLIYFLSSVPNLNSGLGTWDTVLRKGAHVFEYAVLAGLLWRALRRSATAWSWRRAAMVVAALSVAYAGSDEFHQGFVPGRGPSGVDVMIDSVGVALALLVVRRFKIYE